MDCKRRLVWGAMMAALPVLAASAAAVGDDHSPRQYYGAWEHHRTYSYRSYYYKPTSSYAGYRHHYVISYPSDHQHYYYYNPYKRMFWGRCDAYGEGQPYYSRLPEESQRPTLADIPESAFPAQGPLPSIPDADDGSHLDLPPDDGPPASGGPSGGAGRNAAPPAPASLGPAGPRPAGPRPAGPRPAGPGPGGPGPVSND